MTLRGQASVTSAAVVQLAPISSLARARGNHSAEAMIWGILDQKPTRNLGSAKQKHVTAYVYQATQGKPLTNNRNFTPQAV